MKFGNKNVNCHNILLLMQNYFDILGHGFFRLSIDYIYIITVIY